MAGDWCKCANCEDWSRGRPNTQASTPVQVCPDCGRPLGANPPSRTGCCYLHIFGGDDGKPGYQMHLLSCQTVTITRLRQELATLQASHDALVAEVDSLPEHFSLSVFVAAGLPLAQASVALMVARRVLEDAENDRAKGGG
jgi:hypothetical protein